jgi:2-aminoethylphosphonate dioxygenase
LTYNVASEGDVRKKYYEDKRKNFPPDFERESGKDYSKGGEIYNVANPITNKTIKN